MINIFIFKYADPEIEDYYYFADRPEIILPNARTTKN